MTAAERRQIRAAEYRRNALAAQALVASSALGGVREKHELAAATWFALAAMDERAQSPAAPPQEDPICTP